MGSLIDKIVAESDKSNCDTDEDRDVSVTTDSAEVVSHCVSLKHKSKEERTFLDVLPLFLQELWRIRIEKQATELSVDQTMSTNDGRSWELEDVDDEGAAGGTGEHDSDPECDFFNQGFLQEVNGPQKSQVSVQCIYVVCKGLLYGY